MSTPLPVVSQSNYCGKVSLSFLSDIEKKEHISAVKAFFEARPSSQYVKPFLGGAGFIFEDTIHFHPTRVIHNLNLCDRAWGLPVEQLEWTLHFATEHVDLLKVFHLTSSVESTPTSSDKHPSTCNIYSSVLVSLQVIGSSSARSRFPAEPAPPV